MKEATERVQKLRAALGRAEHDDSFTHWLTKGNTRSKHPSPSSIRDALNVAEIKMKKFKSLDTKDNGEKENKKNIDVGENAADAEIEMSFRLTTKKVQGAASVVEHIERTVRDLLRHAQQAERQVISGIWGPNTEKEGDDSVNDNLYLEFTGVFLDDLDDEYEESNNSSHVKNGQEKRQMEWMKLLMSLRTRKSMAISARLTAMYEAKLARRMAKEHDTNATEVNTKATEESIVRDRIAAKDLPNSLVTRATTRAGLEQETVRRDSALKLMVAIEQAEETAGTNNTVVLAAHDVHKPLSFESRLADVVHQVVLKSGSMDASAVEVMLHKAAVELSVATAVNQVGAGTALSANQPGLNVNNIVQAIHSSSGGLSSGQDWSKILKADEKAVRVALYHTMRILQKGNVMILNAAKICLEVDTIHKDIIVPDLKSIQQKLSPVELARQLKLSNRTNAVARADANVTKQRKMLERARLARSNPLFFVGKESEWEYKTVVELEQALEMAKEKSINTR